jgi:hypothetical protein
MPDDKKKDPQNRSRIVIEGIDTPPAEKPEMDRYGRYNPWNKRWINRATGQRRVSRRA